MLIDSAHKLAACCAFVIGSWECRCVSEGSALILSGDFELGSMAFDRRLLFDIVAGASECDVARGHARSLTHM